MSDKKKEETGSWAPKAMVGIALLGIVVSVAAGRVRSNANPEELQAAGSGTSTLALIVPWTIVILLAAVIYYLVFHVLRGTTSTAVHKFNDAALLEQMNRLGEAEAILKEIEPELQGSALLKSSWQSALANIEYERGKFKESCAVYEELINSADLKPAVFKQSRLACVDALAEQAAQSGMISSAEFALEQGRGCDMIEKQGPLVRAQIILLARKRDYSGAVHLAQQEWRLTDTAAATKQRTRYRVVWAFALQQLDAQKNAEQIANLVAGVKPYWKGQFYPLTNNWPEMEAFLVQHKLTDEYATA